ncbi:MAG: DUF2987 domain-containing protein [Pseudomonadota bacterium]
MKQFLLIPLILLSTQVFADPIEREWAPYRKLAEAIKLDKFAAAPLRERDKVKLSAVLTPANKAIKAEDIVLTLVDGGAKHSFRVDAQHRVELPFNQKWFDNNALLMINQAKGEKMSISFSLDALLPAGEAWPYASLMGSVAQANDLIKSQAGMMSLLVPKIKSVALRFDHPAQLKIAAKSGVRVLATDAKNTIWLKPDDALMQENPLMTPSERPRAADLEND